MGKFINALQVVGAASAVILLLGLALPLTAVAADKDASPEKGVPEASEPKDADKSKEEAKPDETPPPDAKSEEAPPAGGDIQSSVKSKDILAEGFLIRTTVLVPADAVTRQIGQVPPMPSFSPCKNKPQSRLKAYVKEGLTDIASCTVFR